MTTEGYFCEVCGMCKHVFASNKRKLMKHLEQDHNIKDLYEYVWQYSSKCELVEDRTGIRIL